MKVKSFIVSLILFPTLALVFAGCGIGNTTTSQLSTATQLLPSTQPTSRVMPAGTTTAPASGIVTPTTSSTSAISTPAASTTVSTPVPPRLTMVVTGSANVEVNGGGFSPVKITIAVGTTINWVVPQHENIVVESETEGIDGFAISFWTGAQTTFTVPGTYTFHLEDGPYVTCVITVVAQ